MGRAIVSDRTWRFAIEVDELWERLSAVEEYPQWWPWLRRFHPDRGLETSSRWQCTVAPPLPYVVRFTVELESVRAGERVTARIDGDIRGRAELTVGSRGNGQSTATLSSDLRPADPVLRRVAGLAPPIVRWGHDWVLDQGRRQFVERALGGHGD